MKKIIVLAAFCIIAGSIPAQDITIDKSCPASVSSNAGSGYSTTNGATTTNGSKGYDARTTVTDTRGNQSTYSTPAGRTSSSQGYSSQTSKIEVTCTPSGM